VLTREISAAAAPDDPSALEIPEGIDVYRTNAWELGELPGLLGRAGSSLGGRFLAPDKERLWEMFSRRKAARIVKYDGIDLVYTASAPKSSHLLGIYLKKKFPQIPWVADVRAEIPVNTESVRAYSNNRKSRVESKLDRRIYMMADCMVTDTEGIRKAILENSGIQGTEERCFMIPDRYTEELSGVFEKSCRMLASKRLISK
jgi:hypothetical protein